MVAGPNKDARFEFHTKAPAASAAFLLAAFILWQHTPLLLVTILLLLLLLSLFRLILVSHTSLPRVQHDYPASATFDAHQNNGKDGRKRHSSWSPCAVIIPFVCCFVLLTPLCRHCHSVCLFNIATTTTTTTTRRHTACLRRRPHHGAGYPVALHHCDSENGQTPEKVYRAFVTRCVTSFPPRQLFSRHAPGPHASPSLGPVPPSPVFSQPSLGHVAVLCGEP